MAKLIINASTIHKTNHYGALASLYAFGHIQAMIRNPQNTALQTTPNSPASIAHIMGHLPTVYNKYKSAALTKLINDYKLGQVDTDGFLSQLLKQHFAGLDKINFPSEVKQKIVDDAAKYHFLSSRELPKTADDLSNEDVAYALLEDAWASRVDPYDKEYKTRIGEVEKRIEEQNFSPITLISNSNPIDIHRIRYQLAKATDKFENDKDHPQWCGQPVTFKMSYHTGCYKTAEQNQKANIGETSIIESLLSDDSEAHFLNHYPGELKEAEKFISKDKIIDANKQLTPIHFYDPNTAKVGLVVGGVLGLALSNTTYSQSFMLLAASSVLMAAIPYNKSWQTTALSTSLGLFGGQVARDIVETVYDSVTSAFAP